MVAGNFSKRFNLSIICPYFAHIVTCPNLEVIYNTYSSQYLVDFCFFEACFW